MREFAGDRIVHLSPGPADIAVGRGIDTDPLAIGRQRYHPRRHGIVPLLLVAGFSLGTILGSGCGEQKPNPISSPTAGPTATEPATATRPASSPTPEKQAEQTLFQDYETYASTANNRTTGVFDATNPTDRKGGIVFSWLPEQGLFIHYIVKTQAGGFDTPVYFARSEDIQKNGFNYSVRDGFLVIEGNVDKQGGIIEGKIWRRGKTPSGNVELLLQYNYKAIYSGKQTCSAADATREMKGLETKLGTARVRLDDLVAALNKTGNTLPCAP